MNPDPTRVRQIFGAAREKGSASERAVFLDKACRGDAALRQRVEALLRLEGAAETFFVEPARVPKQPET